MSYADKEKKRDALRQWRLKNPDKARAATKRSYENNSEKRRAEARKRYYADVEKSRKKARDWQRKNRKINTEQNRAYQRKYQYGVSVAFVAELRIQQKQCCAICAVLMDGKTVNTRECVDHDHVLKHVRGLLCHRCNRTLGGFYDNASLCRKAAAYLEGHALDTAPKPITLR